MRRPGELLVLWPVSRGIRFVQIKALDTWPFWFARQTDCFSKNPFYESQQRALSRLRICIDMISRTGRPGSGAAAAARVVAAAPGKVHDRLGLFRPLVVAWSEK